MGLDNGICLRDKAGEKDQELCCFRKHWRLRNRVISYLETKYNKNCDGECVFLDAEDLDWFTELIESIDNEKEYVGACEGYWEYNDTVHEYLQNYKYNLQKAKNMLEDNPGVRCYWYDSY